MSINPRSNPAWSAMIDFQSRSMKTTESSEQRPRGLLSFAKVKRLLVDAA
jgi:hypothetical protein